MLISQAGRTRRAAGGDREVLPARGTARPGHPTSATRATYDDTHVRRLRLVRALVDVGGLSLAAVRDVLAALDDPNRSQRDLLGAAHKPLLAGPAPSLSINPRWTHR